LALVLTALSARVASAQTTFTWLGSTGDWFTPTNWSPNGVPGVLDTAIVSSGTVTANSQVFVANLTLGGTLGGSGDVTVTDALVWNDGGAMNGSGHTIVAAGATGMSQGGEFLRRPLDVLGTFVYGGNGNWSLGGGTLTVFSGGEFDINTSGTGFYYGGAVPNSIVIQSSGVFKKLGSNSAGIAITNPGISLTNNGTIEIDSGTLTIGGGGASTGTITVAGGALLQPTGSYTFGGPPVTGQGSVDFYGGTQTLNTAFNLMGSTSIESPAAVNTSVDQSWSQLGLYGTLGGSGNVTITGTLGWNNSATMNGSGHTIIAVGASGTITSGGFLRRPLDIAGTLTLAGTGSSANLSLGGGTLTVTQTGRFVFNTTGSGIFYGGATLNMVVVEAGGVLQKLGNGSAGIALTNPAIPLTNNGTIDVEGGTLSIGGGGTSTGTISVAAGTVFQTMAGFAFDAGSSLSGAGSVDLYAGVQTVNTTINVGGWIAIEGAATANVDEDQAWPNPVTLTGVLGGSGNVTLAGSLVWNDGAIMNGAGRTILAAGATGVVIPGGSGGTSLRRALDVNGTLTHGGTGSLTLGGGTLTVKSGGELDLNTTGIGYFYGGAIPNAVVVEAGGLLKKLGSTSAGIALTNPAIPLTNSGTIDVEGGTLTIGGTVTNLSGSVLAGGTWIIEPSAGIAITSPAGVSIQNLASGTTLVLRGAGPGITNSGGGSALGALNTVGGMLELTNRTQITAPVSGTFMNTGRLVLDVGGQLAVTGGFNQSSTGVSRFGLGGLAAGSFGRISATGAASLAGSAEAAFIDPPYIPAAGDTFAVITAQSMNGSFAKTCVDQLVSGLGVYGVATSGAMNLVVSPLVVGQPSDAMACLGSSTSFTVVAAGTSAHTYQWQHNGLSLADQAGHISGSTAATLSLTNVVAADAGSYSCVVSDLCFTGMSNSATLTVDTPVAITGNPSSQALCPGNSVCFTAAASGSPSPAYQWRKNGNAISGAVSQMYCIPSVSSADAGTYDCVAANLCGSMATSGAVLTVYAPPSISTQPSPQTVCTGQPYSFTVIAASNPAPTYQWRHDGAAIAGAVGTTFGGTASATDAGNYDCVITNTCGSVTTTVVSLTVNTPVSITSQPTSETECSGSAFSFSITATGVPTPSYQWRLYGVNIPGAIASSYGGTSSTSNAGSYDCIVSNPCNQVTSSAVALTVNTSPGVDTQPASQTVCEGSAFSFSVVASGTPAPTYQWRFNGTDIAGATNNSYGGTATTADQGSYDCVLTNSCGAATTFPASLTVNTAAHITSGPSSQTVCSGSSFSFAVVASGAPTFQWRLNGTDIPGAYGSSYGGAATLDDAGSYDCVVTNACGTDTSAPASLTVLGSTITSQPGPRTACIGQPVSFNVGAEGGSPTYQWRHNGLAIPGATDPILTIASVAAPDVGLYDCIVNSDQCGANTSSSATLDVYCTCTSSFPDQVGGTCDDFAPPPELTSPRAELLAALAASQYAGLQGIDFDVLPNPSNNSASVLRHSFSDLPIDAIAGTLEFHMKAGSNPGGLFPPTDDAVHIGVAEGGIGTFWWAPMTAIPHLGSWSSWAHPAQDTFTIDLVSAPGGGSGPANLLALINSQGGPAALDLFVEDKTAVDCVTLRLTRPAARAFPWFAQQPTAPCASGPVRFTVAGNPAGAPFSYQWRKGGLNLNDGGHLSGTATATLTITNPNGADTGLYDCIITNTCASATSTPASFCYGNCDCSTVAPILTANDFQCFLNKFAAGDAYANCDGSTVDPVLNANDFACFLNSYAAGCS
jgi:hypothetical protein